MKFSLYIIFFFFLIGNISAQNFSNKGKEFWLVFPPHQPNPGTPANLSLYISSDKASTGKVFVNGIKIQDFDIEPNVTKEYVLDRLSTYIALDDRATVGNQNKVASGKGIHVVVDDGKPSVVVYAHMYAAARSAASIILPSSVLQRKYIVMAYTQDEIGFQEGEPARSQFSVVAIENNTRLKIKFRKNGVVEPNFIEVDLPFKGDVYQYQDLKDLTGTEIESIAIGNNVCNKIAVFSGSSANKIQSFASTSNGGSRDPLFQQCYPENSWGKNYILTDFSGKRNLFFRIIAKEDGTKIKLNGVTIPLNRGQYYESNSTNNIPPFFIESDKPVCVAQFSVSQDFDTGVGDPEMLILNSVEQSIDNVTVFLSSKEDIDEQYVNVIIKDEGIDEFKINNITYQSDFIKIIGTEYSYLKKKFIVSPDSFFSLNMTAKIGFNAFCYGFGGFESYSYSAGTNVRDLYQSVNISNTEAVVPFTRTCVNTPFRFSVTLPYKPVSLKWDFTNNGQLVDDQGNLIPSFTKSLGGAELPADSSYQSENDPNVTLYVYKIDKNFLVKQKADVPYKITTVSSSADGCSGEQVIENIIEVKDPPRTTLVVESDGCVGSAIQLRATNILDEGVDVNFYRWYQDGQLITGETQFELNRTFSTEGSRNISVEMISKIGCVSDKDSEPVNLSFKPKVEFIEDAIRCIGKSFVVKNNSEKVGNSTIAEGFWSINGVKQSAQTAVENLTYSTTLPELRLKYIAKTNTGCIDSTAEKSITINPNPTLDVNLPEFCLTDGVAQFSALSNIESPDLISSIQWDFGDATLNPGTNTAQGTNVSHFYTNPGSYQLKIKSTSNNTCITSKDTLFFVNGSNPNANFKFLNSTFCSNKEIVLENLSTVIPGNITKVELMWQLDDGTIISQLDNEPDTNRVYRKLFENFNVEKKILNVKLVAYSGGSCKDEYDILPTPIYGSAKVTIGNLGEICTGYPAIILPNPELQAVVNTTGTGKYFGSFISNGDVANQFKFTPPKIGLNSFVFYSYVTSQGCETIDTTTISFNPTPIVNAGPDLLLLQDSTIKINATASNGINMRYRWTPTSYLDNPNILQPQIEQPQSDVSYVLTATGKGNCISRDTVKLTSLNILNPPNTLVPGRPPYDKWVIANIQKYTGCVLKIFDINGRLVKSYDNGYDNNLPWNGTRDKTGEYLPAGTYYYILDPKNGRKIQTGYVTIHR